MSYIENGEFRKVVIAHESPDAHFGEKVGGAAAVALNQSREMHKMGRNVELIGPKNGGESRLKIPHQLFSIPETKNNEELLGILKQDEWMSFWEKTLRSQDSEKECDVYGHYFVTGSIMSEMNGAINGKKIYMGHSWDRPVQRMDPDRSINQTREKAEISILNNADAIITSTNAERIMIAQDYQESVEGGEKTILDKVHVVPLGVDSKTFSYDNLTIKRQGHRNNLLGDMKDSLNFYMVGRIAPQKNQLNAVKAFSETLKAEAGLNVSLSIHGGPLKGDYYNEIQEYIETQPEEIKRRIKFHGVQDADVAHATGDIFLGNSVWETFFLAGAEAMSSGKPTIMSNKPILREVAGDGSLFVDETDIMDTASAIYQMATNPELRRYSSSYNSYRAWQNYTWEKSAKRLDQTWQSLRTK